MALSDYERGYKTGADRRREDHDPTWHPTGASSEFERGWNDGYNAEQRFVNVDSDSRNDAGS